MSVASTKTEITPEDLLAMADGVGYELVDGELVEREMGFQSSRIGGRLFNFLENYCEDQQLGWVLPADASFQCFADAPTNVRKPDVSFIRADRLPADEEPTGHCRIAPDLAVEVVSPNESFGKLANKVKEYLAAGVRLVWVVDPDSRTVQVHRQRGGGTILSAEDELSGEDVLPGFRCLIADLFRPPAGTGTEKVT